MNRSNVIFLVVGLVLGLVIGGLAAGLVGRAMKQLISDMRYQWYTIWSNNSPGAHRGRGTLMSKVKELEEREKSRP